MTCHTQYTVLNDPTECIWHQVAGCAQQFEAAALEATSPGRCHQLHERLLACVETLQRADDAVRAQWDSLLAQGKD